MINCECGLGKWLDLNKVFAVNDGLFLVKKILTNNNGTVLPLGGRYVISCEYGVKCTDESPQTR